MIEDDDDINLESFGDELDAPPRFRDRNHTIQVEDEEAKDEDGDNDASDGSRDEIDFNFFITNELLVLELSSCLFETLKLICYLDVMNLFAIFHLDLNVMTNKLIYLVLLKVYRVKADCFVTLLC